MSLGELPRCSGVEKHTENFERKEVFLEIIERGGKRDLEEQKIELLKNALLSFLS